MESQVRQNYHRDCEAAINKMINMELYASYTYTSMVSTKKRKKKRESCFYLPRHCECILKYSGLFSFVLFVSLILRALDF